MDDFIKLANKIDKALDHLHDFEDQAETIDDHEGHLFDLADTLNELQDELLALGSHLTSPTYQPSNV